MSEVAWERSRSKHAADIMRTPEVSVSAVQCSAVLTCAFTLAASCCPLRPRFLCSYSRLPPVHLCSRRRPWVDSQGNVHHDLMPDESMAGKERIAYAEPDVQIGAGMRDVC
jgi:hypothetical protein